MTGSDSCFTRITPAAVLGTDSRWETHRGREANQEINAVTQMRDCGDLAWGGGSGAGRGLILDIL